LPELIQPPQNPAVPLRSVPSNLQPRPSPRGSEHGNPGLGLSPISQVLSGAPRALSYPVHFEIRRVAQDSTIRWNSRKVFVTSTLRRPHIALEQIADGVRSVYFGPIHMEWLDESDYRIMDVKNRKSRRR
jgi:hypothetical protein